MSAASDTSLSGNPHLSATARRLGVRNGHTKQLEAWKRAARVTPRGVHSNFRYWGDDSTPVMARGKGSHLWDVDGNEFIDFRSGFGAVLLGHGYDPVCDAVNEAMRNGTVFTLSTPWETKVAERMIKMVPGLEMVRFCNSGTEATMHAVRLARGYTGREKIIKFEGHFHGVHDYLLWSTAGSNPAGLGYRQDPIPYQMSSGIPQSNRGLIITVPFNDQELLTRAVDRHGHDVAAIICEPLMGNAASLAAEPEWLTLVRRLCDENGILFILDEVKTGFRVARGGAAERYGIRPDLYTYAKALGNGFPVAAFGGKRKIMDAIGPGRIAHGGTFNGNVVAMAAADKVLETLEDGSVIEQIGRQGEKLSRGVSELLARFDVPHMLSGPPQMWGLLLTDRPVRELRDVFTTHRPLYTRIAMELYARGVLPEPDVREPWFMSYSHSDDDIAVTLELLEDVLKSLPADVLHPEDEEEVASDL